MQFDKNFFLGAATAAHQVEGGNIHSDYWAQEHMVHTDFLEPSGDAVDHYHRYAEDIRLMAQAGLNAYRFSIEWARIEPEEGRFDEAQVLHYRDVINTCRENGIEPVVTLLHFTSPKWLISKGGWESDETPGYFARYTRYVMERLGNDLRYVCTINEANMGIQVAAIAKRYMRQMMAKMQAAGAGGQAAAGGGTATQKGHVSANDGTAMQNGQHTREESPAAQCRTQASQQSSQNSAAAKDTTVQMGLNLEKMMANQKAAEAERMELFGVPKTECFTSPRTPHGDEIVMEAHRAARAVIRKLMPHVRVGLTLSLHDIQALPGGEERAAKEWDEEFLHYLPAIKDDDFLGVQNYTRTRMDASGALPVPDGAEVTQMDYEFYPQALANVLRRVAADFKGDLLVTENGIATSDDARRVAFIQAALCGVKSCLEENLPVKGYFYWSLLDNFEWQKGYSMTFGLVAVDRATQTRHPKESLSYLGSLRG
ncbi:MAG: family 1 glycosylhydrolase [Lachnospiraceae bacterium]|jgi:beta-glucosidase|nr:family 1 glycosylhydrolase [uncultured Acetatifactor sp.]MCI9229789.1 family 1 glycosylhydrolase [Lachnospiraceae bacterium]MCI9573296.1 family 1 glycosylhydrolase [Lachnospiraceae bacterium]